MAKDKNSFSKISQAPPPPTETPLRRGSYVPTAKSEPARPSAETMKQAEFNFQEAVRHCNDVISKGRNAGAVDQTRWTYETKRFSEIWWPQLEEAFAECERAGMHVDKIRNARTRIKKDYELVCDYRKSLASGPMAETASVDPFKTGAPGRPTAAHLVKAEAKRRIASCETATTLAQFSRDLAAWYEEERQKSEPAGPTLTARTIENIVRPLWRQVTSSPRD
jgi:hypothetical protein